MNNNDFTFDFFLMLFTQWSIHKSSWGDFKHLCSHLLDLGSFIPKRSVVIEIFFDRIIDLLAFMRIIKLTSILKDNLV